MMTIRVREELVVGAVFFFAVGACDTESNQETGLGRRRAASTVTMEGKRISEKSDPEAVLGALYSSYRLKPDRRFTQAIPALDAVLGRDGKEVKCEFGGDKWRLSYEGKALAEVSEMPSFDELYAVVLKRAEQLAKELSISAMPGSQGNVELPAPGFEALRELSGLDKKLKKRNTTAAEARQAARAFLSVMLGLVDTTETADALSAKAVAVVALADALTPDGANIERALLARLLGYEKSALKLLASSTDHDPIAAFIRGDVDKLRKIAGRGKADLATTVMYLWSLITSGDTKEARKHIATLSGERRTSLPILALSLLSERWTLRRPVTRTLLVNALQGINTTLNSPLKNTSKAIRTGPWGFVVDLIASDEIIAKIIGKERGQLFPEIESALDGLAKLPHGPLLDADSHTAYYRALIFTAVDTEGRDLLENLGSIEAAKEFAGYLGKADSRIGRQFKQYFEDLVSADERKLPIKELVADIRDLKSFGPRALYRLYRDIEQQAMLDPELLQAAKEFSRRADTRLPHRDFMYYIARWGLTDPAMGEKLSRSILSETRNEYPYLRFWMARAEGDLNRAETLLRDPRLTAYQRTNAVKLLSKFPGIDNKRIYREYERLVDSFPGDRVPAESFIEYLMDNKDYSRAIREAKKYLKHPDRQKGLTELWMKDSIAGSLWKQGKLEKAWKTVEPTMVSQFGLSYWYGALIKSAMGNHEEAVDIAQKCLKRYPFATSAVLLARVLWEAGRFDQAAAALTDPRYKLVINDWRWKVGKHFYEVFKDKPIEAGKTAFAKLVDKKISPRLLYEVAKEVSRLGGNELAFAVNTQIRAPGFGMFLMHSASYGYLKSLKGKQAALTWLRKVVPEAQRDPLSQFGYDKEQYELPWEVVRDPAASNPHATAIWLMRAASFIRSGANNPQWKERLEVYYRQEKDDFYYAMGAHLMGKVDEKTAWSSVKEDKQRPEAAYYIGLAAQARGEIERAVAWFRAAVETGQVTNSETGWAYHQLSNWRDQNVTLARLDTN